MAEPVLPKPPREVAEDVLVCEPDWPEVELEGPPKRNTLAPPLRYLPPEWDRVESNQPS